MNLVIDIGNTNAKWAIFDNQNMLTCNILNSFSLNNVLEIVANYPLVKNLAISNNRKPIKKLQDFCDNKKIKLISITHLSKLPITINYESPDTLGVDRISLAIGASFKYPGNTLIIDLGTCITYDLLLEGQYIGGQISPGISMRLSSLHTFTANLPNLKFKYIEENIGKNTTNSMLIGVLDSILFEIENVIEKYKTRYPNIGVVLTGGDLNIVKNKIKHINFVSPYLLMEGLNYIIAFNE